MQGYNYKLETHLKVLCEENKEFENLCSSWILNKKTYTEVLGTIKLNFPHYSLHDASHSESIITNIEMILGEERIKKLSPSDTWMLLNCSYLHDFGMAVLYSDVKNEWIGEEFQKYLRMLKNSYDKNLKEAACYIDDFSKNLNQNNEQIELDSIWPLRIKKYVTDIVSDYYRRKHSNMSKKYLENLREWELDFTQNGLIKDRFIELIGQISVLHTRGFDEVMELDYQTNGYNGDYIHPRFIAVMLRLGDLLDLDNGRFSEAIEKVSGELSDTSKVHKAKHKATKHILVNTSEIQFRADCENDDVYRVTRDWISWLEEELKNSSLNINDIFPKDLGGYIPKLTKREMLLDGNPDLEGKANLKFRISQEKAFDIIEGSNIYEDKATFIREFTQNALDASKIQLWNDLNEGIYDFCLKDKLGENIIGDSGIKYEELTPFDLIKCKIFDNYEINVYINSIGNDKVEVIVEDKGTGISINKLRDMCEVGESYDNCRNRDYCNIEKIPTWLRPTGGFGIGLQSAFLVTKQFRAYTKCSDSQSMEIIFEPAINGYISIKNFEKNLKRGTKIVVELGDIGTFNYSFGGRVDDFINNKYDLFKSTNLVFYKMIDYAVGNILSEFFKVNIYANGEKQEVIEYYNIEKEYDNFEEYDDRYIYKKTKKLDTLKIWDKKNSIYFTISIMEIENLKSYLSNLNLTTIFKGAVIKKKNLLGLKGLDIIADIYGFDTKESIKLNREELTSEGKGKLYCSLEEVVKIYLKIIGKNLKKIKDSKKNIDKEKIDLFKFIILSIKYLDDFDYDSNECLLDEFNHKITVFKKRNDIYEKDDIEFKEIYYSLQKGQVYLKYESNSLDPKEEYDYKIVGKLLNENKERINYDTIIADREFINIMSEEYIINEITYIDATDEITKDKLFIYSSNRENKWKVKVDDITKQYIVNNLAIKGKKKMFYKLGASMMRCSIPAVEEYSLLAVKKSSVLYRMASEFEYTQQVISPITKDDADNIEEFENRRLFIESIVKREDYKNLIDYTIKNQIEKNHTYDEIDKKYRELIGIYYDEMMKNNDNNIVNKINK